MTMYDSDRNILKNSKELSRSPAKNDIGLKVKNRLVQSNFPRIVDQSAILKSRICRGPVLEGREKVHQSNSIENIDLLNIIWTGTGVEHVRKLCDVEVFAFFFRGRLS